MEREHCSMADSHVKFKTTNYGITTCPADEWRIVKICDKRFEASTPHKRVIPRFQSLKKEALAQRANLDEEEIIAVILYTGPMVNDCLFFFLHKILIICFESTVPNLQSRSSPVAP
jgi:hypothetical protein